MTKPTGTPSGLSTRAIHGRQIADPATGAVIPPIYATSTFAQSSPGHHLGFEYSRSCNPTRSAFESALAELEGGAAAFAFASGLAAEAVILELLEHGSHIVASDDIYGGTWRLFHRVRSESANLAVTHVDAADPAAIERAITPRTGMIWIETPGNPLLKLADLEAVGEIARRRHVLAVADNTFASPAVQWPLRHGFDLVIHSVTKYIGGHSDLVGGAIIAGDDADLIQRLAFLQNATGAILDPFSSFLALRGLKTLPLRMERHAGNALAVARHLEQHPRARRVIYPGLVNHPQHHLAVRQMRNGGGIVSVYIDGGEAETVAILERFRVFTLAESLGGIESLVGYPSKMSHGALPPEQKKARGIDDNLIRLSVGIEDVEDLIADLDLALG
ncbi:MAG TPA: aminotransferase class I/II-fold pyridoxal phosphate-dependent enzyme [Rhodospirillaceae bacterium]|nr:aminotransferase class I/II-fold pyridoxal phosphate-dependent enzyme [Rhodospirillaceae bacterium]